MNNNFTSNFVSSKFYTISKHCIKLLSKVHKGNFSNSRNKNRFVYLNAYNQLQHQTQFSDFIAWFESRSGRKSILYLSNDICSLLRIVKYTQTYIELGYTIDVDISFIELFLPVLNDFSLVELEKNTNYTCSQICDVVSILIWLKTHEFEIMQLVKKYSESVFCYRQSEYYFQLIRKNHAINQLLDALEIFENIPYLTSKYAHELDYILKALNNAISDLKAKKIPTELRSEYFHKNIGAFKRANPMNKKTKITSSLDYKILEYYHRLTYPNFSMIEYQSFGRELEYKLNQILIQELDTKKYDKHVAVAALQEPIRVKKIFYNHFYQ